LQYWHEGGAPLFSATFASFPASSATSNASDGSSCFASGGTVFAVRATEDANALEQGNAIDAMLIRVDPR